MMRSLVAICFVLGVVVAEPITKLPYLTDGLDAPFHDTTNNSNQQLSRVLPDVPAYLILDIINALVGNKFSTAISIGVFIIEWLVSNCMIILIGAASAVGFCKLTGKCGLDYEPYVPIESLRSVVTPEYLEMAENFFVSAVEKYAEKTKTESRTQPLVY